jgi:CheY-like chemotaxis protein
VVIVSVMDDQPTATARGAAGYLSKPFTRVDIQQMLRTLEHGKLQSSNQPMPPQPTACQRSHAPPVLLLAEDNEANITTLSDYFAARGYQVVVARNGAEAVARAREARPAIVLMDIQMPGMDGLEATRRIRADRDIPQMPIIALTALAMPGDRERCLMAGATDYLSKPVSLKGLVAKLETHVQRSSAQSRTFQ